MVGSAPLTYLVLDLGDDLDVLAARAQHGPDGVDVAGLAHEAGRDEVHLVRHAELLQVLDVLHTAKQSKAQTQRRSQRIGQGGRSAHLLRQRGQVHHRSCSHSTAQTRSRPDIHTYIHEGHVTTAPGRFMFFLSPKLALFSTSAITEASLISATRSSSAPSAAGRAGQVREGSWWVGDTGRGREGRDTYEDPAAHGDGLRQRLVRAGQVGGRAQPGVVRAHLNQLPLHQLQLASEGGVHCARADLRTLRVCHAGHKKGRNEGRNVLRDQEKYSPTFNKFHIYG